VLLGVDELGLLLPDDMPLPDEPLPMRPDAPDVSLLLDGEPVAAPDEPEPEVPEAPEEPEEPDEPDEPEAPEAPVVPAVPESLLLGLDVAPDMPPPEVEPAPVEDWASTTEETDATSTNDRDRIVVFNVMSSSLD